MIIEVCLIIIAATLVLFVLFLIGMALKVKQSVELLQLELYQVSYKTTQLLDHLSKFVTQDMQRISTASTSLINKVEDLTDDVQDKSKSLNFLFHPLSFLNSENNSDLFPSKGGEKKTFPQIIKWVALSATLITTTKELIKKYVK